MIKSIQNILMSNLHLSEKWAENIADIFFLLLLGLISLGVYKLLRNYLLRLIHHMTLKTTNQWDDALMDAKVFHRVLQLIPVTLSLLILEQMTPGLFIFLKRVLLAWIVLLVARIIDGFFESISTIYHSKNSDQRKPIRPFIQVLIIVDYLIASIMAIGILINKSPWHLFGLLGGLTAVTMLVFKDTILGFVAGIQLGANDMIREGDWIEMPKYGADGDVIEVTVNTVKVQNWDKTISTIPTYALISDSFKNWRGMSESAGRRIKRSIFVDMTSVRFADDEMLAKFRKIEFLKEYVEKKQSEIEAENKKKKIDLSSTVVNGRRQTNLGIFRAYLERYLHNHPKINKDLTFLVRHLQPTSQGLPIEIYVFSSDKVWANYEAIQADIFDHILAALPEFGLRVFQEPTGADFAQLLTSKK